MSYTTLGQTMMVAAPTLSTRAAPLPCITSAEKAKAELDCRIPDVKGLGFTYGTNTRFAGQDACAIARLPVCATAPVFVRATLPPPPPATVRTATLAPISTAVTSSMRLPPNVVTVPPPPEPVPQEKKAFFGLGVGGMLAVLAVGGGAVYYFTRKKAKAA
jgi:hypothetical protein